MLNQKGVIRLFTHPFVGKIKLIRIIKDSSIEEIKSRLLIRLIAKCHRGLPSRPLFRCVLASLYEVVSVGWMVGWIVRR